MGPESWLFTEFFPKRPAILKEKFREQGLYPVLNAPIPMVSPDKKSLNKVILKNPDTQGDIIYTIDGRDPRERWSSKPKGQKYQEPLTLVAGATLRARVFSKGEWSALMVYQVP